MTSILDQFEQGVENTFKTAATSKQLVIIIKCIKFNKL